MIRLSCIFETFEPVTTCEFFNFSDSFFSEQLNLEDQNRFIPLAKDTETRTPSTGSKNNKIEIFKHKRQWYKE